MNSVKFIYLGKIIFLLSAILLYQHSFSQDKKNIIIVTAEKLKEKRSQTSSSRTIISRKEIEASRASHVFELLQKVPGLNISTTGGMGGSTFINLRGTQSSHLLVLIDGVPLNDAISPSRAFDFASLSTLGIERIEILRGSQSVLFGSDAIGGVIHIITQKGHQRDAQLNVEYGSFKHRKMSLTTQNKKKKLNYSFGVERLQNEGLSSASKGSEKDSLKSTSLNMSLTYNLSQKQALTYGGRYNKSTTELDDTSGQTFVLIDDPNYIGIDENNTQSLKYKHFLAGQLDTKSIFTFSKYNRVNINDRDTNNPNQFKNDFKSQTKKIEHQGDFLFNERHIFTYGLNYKKEQGESLSSSFKEQDVYSSALFLQHYYNSEDVFYTIGLREENHETFDHHLSYKLGPGFHFKKATFKAHLATGFKAPSLFQLYSQFGNLNLQPEQGRSLDFGVDYAFSPNFKVSFTYFRTKIKNLIIFATTNYANEGQLKAKGIESSLSFSQKNFFDFNLTYTKTETKTGETRQQLLQVPRSFFAGEISYTGSEKIVPALEFFYKGRRDNLDSGQAYPAPRAFMPSYTLVNFSLLYHYQRYHFLFKLKNLLNKKYEDIHGYSAANRSFFLSMKMSLF